MKSGDASPHSQDYISGLHQLVVCRSEQVIQSVQELMQFVLLVAICCLKFLLIDYRNRACIFVKVGEVAVECIEAT